MNKKSSLSIPGVIVFVPVRATPAADICARDNFWTTFFISFISGRIDGPHLLNAWLEFGRFLPWPDLQFLRSNMEFSISQPKMVRLPRNKKHNWTLGIKWEHQVWPWLWPWPWIFKVKCGICFILAKNGPIVTKRKTNTRIELKASNGTIRFELGHDLDLEFSNREFAISQPTMVRLPQNKMGLAKVCPWGLFY